MTDTIFALSSGLPPAAIAIIRISGPSAGAALRALAGTLPKPRVASYRTLEVPRGTILDHSLVIWFPGANTATGEDLAELHLHGGRAVIAAVQAALATFPNLRAAEPGEFTRRAFANGKIDLAEAEGLADLLSAETELQRRSAILMADGAFSRQVETWRQQVLLQSAGLEALLDFSDEDDVPVEGAGIQNALRALQHDLAEWLNRPRADSLREGFRVVLAGPPNAGKSTLFNALVDEDAAITSSLAGTTRDVLHRSVAMDGVPFLFVDTAGLRDETSDAIEAIGIERARSALQTSDLVLWLGPEMEGPDGAWEVDAQIDRPDHAAKGTPKHRVSAMTGQGIASLRKDLIAHARTSLPKPGQVALNERQHAGLAVANNALRDSLAEQDHILIAECLRRARVAFDALVGRTATEDMLDTLFAKFCIGK